MNTLEITSLKDPQLLEFWTDQALAGNYEKESTVTALAEISRRKEAGAWNPWGATEAAATMGRKGGAVKGGAKAAAASKNGAKGGRPAATYTVRVPGQSYWWQGQGIGDARQAAKEARFDGLAVKIYKETPSGPVEIA